MQSEMRPVVPFVFFISAMKIIFLHRNFPAQFRHLATVLAQDPRNQVVFITNRQEGELPNVKKILYAPARSVHESTHHYVRNLEEAVLDGQGVCRVAIDLKKAGFYPDYIYAHSGWGVGLFMKDLFPKAQYLCYFEWYYHAHGTDADFDPREPIDLDGEARIRVKNAPILLDLVACDRGLAPTFWQRQQFPPEFQSKITVIHDGVDLQFFEPNPTAKVGLKLQITQPNIPPGLEGVDSGNQPTHSPMGSSLDNPMANSLANPMANPNPIGNPIANPVDSPVGNPVTNPMGNPVANPVANPVVNPIANVDNSVANPIANPMGNPVANPMGNPVAKMNNPVANPIANPIANPMGKPVANVDNSVGNPIANPMENPVANPMGNSMDDLVGNSMANPMGNSMGNPIANPMVSPIANPIDDLVGNPMGNFLDSSGANLMGDPINNLMNNAMGDPVGNSRSNSLGNLTNNPLSFSAPGNLSIDLPQPPKIQPSAPNLVAPEPFLDLEKIPEVITYVSRGLEPYRGFPQFMEALALVQKMRPQCHALIVGEDRVAYGKRLPNGKTYKTLMLEQVPLDLSRVHFTGHLPYSQYLKVLQISSVHVYLTRPFVLSWSMLEAMATGCLVVASRTAPVQEVIESGVNGFLVDFFDVEGLAQQIATVLDRQQKDPHIFKTLRQQARQTIADRYHLQGLLPVHYHWLQGQ